jgi:hypothetical protein
MSWYFFFFAATRAFHCLSLLYYANTRTLIKIGTAAPARSAGQANKARSSGLGESSLMTRNHCYGFGAQPLQLENVMSYYY